jgi:pimeloyl-ACP methyl ester carboxylesterase
VSPRWAGEITRALAARLTTVELVTIPDHGHDAIDMAPDLIIDELCRFLDKD